MKFASTRLIAADIKSMVGFYEKVTRQSAEWLAPVFAEIMTPAATLAIGSAETAGLFSAGSAEPAANRTAIIEFQVDDVDAEFARLKDAATVVQAAEDDAMGKSRGSIPRSGRHARQPIFASHRCGEAPVRLALRRRRPHLRTAGR